MTSPLFQGQQLFSEDIELLHQIGIRFDPKHRLPYQEEKRLGEVELKNGAKIDIFATSTPAFFFRFDVKIGDTTFRVTTGSGSLHDYWPSIMQLAKGEPIAHNPQMISVAKLPKKKPRT